MLPHNLTICTYLYHSQKLRDAEADEQQHLLTTPKQLAAIFRCREQISVRTSGRSPNLTKPGMTPDRHVRLPFRPWSSDRRHNCHRCGNQTTSSHHSSRRGQRTLRLISNRTRLTSKRVNLVTVNDPLHASGERAQRRRRLPGTSGLPGPATSTLGMPEAMPAVSDTGRLVSHDPSLRVRIRRGRPSLHSVPSGQFGPSH